MFAIVDDRNDDGYDVDVNRKYNGIMIMQALVSAATACGARKGRNLIDKVLCYMFECS